jgi:hypothetical protein
MTNRKHLLPLALASMFVLAGGSAWAVSQGDDAPEPAQFKPTTGELVRGTTSSGDDYTLSGIDPVAFGDPYFAQHPSEWFCTALTTSSGPATQGCSPVPDAKGQFEGEPLKPSYSLLGANRFFWIIAPGGVAAMEVTVKGETESTRARSIDAGAAGKLLLAAVGGPLVTSRDPSSSRDYTVRLLDPGGGVVNEFTMTDPPLD